MTYLLVSLDRMRFIGPFESMDDAFEHMTGCAMIGWYVAQMSTPSEMD